ncbi:MAG: K(+)-transporting ATPase subunit F [Pseudomonadota bacterium]
MSWFYVIGLLVAAELLIFLLVALIQAEKF